MFNSLNEFTKFCIYDPVGAGAVQGGSINLSNPSDLVRMFSFPADN